MTLQQMHNNPNVNVWLFQKIYVDLLTYYYYQPSILNLPANQLLHFQRSAHLFRIHFPTGGCDLEESRFFGPPRLGTSAKIMEIWTCAGWNFHIHVDCFFFGGGPSKKLVEHLRRINKTPDGWKISFLPFWDTVSPSCQVPCCAAKLMRWNPKHIWLPGKRSEYFLMPGKSPVLMVKVDECKSSTSPRSSSWTSWWFQPMRKMLVKLDHFPK